jgi:hypothetical protein
MTSMLISMLAALQGLLRSRAALHLEVLLAAPSSPSHRPADSTTGTNAALRRELRELA